MLDTSNNNCNPEKLPLGALKLAGIDGVRRQVPALDPYWVTREQPFRSYICMLSSYGRIKTGGALDEWLHIAASWQHDLEFLLRLSHHEFWSYVLYEESVMSAVSTFLQRANPYYRLASATSSASTPADAAAIAKAEAIYAQLLQLVVRVIMRLLTPQESPTEWIEPDQHRSLLYSNYLISVPLLFDLAIALGDATAENVDLLERIFASVLHLQPDYKRDLQEGLAFYENAFLSMQIQVDNEGCEGAGGGALLDADDAETPYDDVVLFALDCAYTLRVLLRVCPALAAICEEVKLAQSIANFYDLTVPLLYRNICLVNAQASCLRWLNEARQQFLAAVRCIASAQLARAQREPKSGTAQRFVEMLQECLSAQTFVIDYQRHYPVELDVELLLQSCPTIKDYKVDFVVAGYQKALSSCATSIMADEQLSSSQSSGESDDDSRVSPTPEAVATPISNSRDIDLEVSAVLDVLPDLGTGFIRRLLTRYENSEQSIAAILDDNLPPDLSQMDRQEVFIPADPREKFQRQSGVEHFNVHDGDRFDVLTQDEPQCIIKQGKGLPGGPRNAEQLLDDKRHINELKERYQKYALVEENPDEDAEYNDEYDDSYEALIDGQAAPKRRQPQQLQQQQQQQRPAAENSVYEAPDKDSDSDNSEEEDGANSNSRNGRQAGDFCENPEVVRARYAAMRQAKWGQRAAPAAAAPPRDVVGAPKGQGQSKDTLRQRGQKEAQKSSRANHNRKSGAAFKRSKGMMS